MESFTVVCKRTLCPKMTSARSGYVWSEVGDFTSMMSLATAQKDAYFGLDNDRPILRTPEERKKKRYGISHHMCIHDWDQDVLDIAEETNNQRVNACKDSEIRVETNEHITNGHEKLRLTTSDLTLMSENSDESEDTLEKILPPFHERYSKIFHSMGDVDLLESVQGARQPTPSPRQHKQHEKGKPPIAPKPLVFRTQSDSKFTKPPSILPMRPRSGTAESELAIKDERVQNEDELNKNVIRGYNKRQPVVRPVKPPMPAPRKSINIVNDEAPHTTPQKEVVSLNIEKQDNENKLSAELNSNDITEGVAPEGTSSQIYGIIESNNQNGTSKPTPAPRISPVRDSGSRYSVNLEQIISASPKWSDEDKRTSVDSCGRYSLDLDNLKARGESSSDEGDPQRVSNISDTNNELNDSFKEDLPTAHVHNMQGRIMKDKSPRAVRESVRALHVPVRERAALFERIVADIRASSDSSSRSSSVSSWQSQTPPGSPRQIRSMSSGWEREINLRLGVNRSRDSSQQSSSTSRSGSSRTNRPISRSMSSGSVFSDYRQSYSSDDLPQESVNIVPVYDDSKEEFYNAEQLTNVTEEVPMLPERCQINRDDLLSARIITSSMQEPSQDNFYGNINELEQPRGSQDHIYMNEIEQPNASQDHIYNEPPKEEETDVKLKCDSNYEVYLHEGDLVREMPAERRKIQQVMDGYHSDDYQGDIDNKDNVEEKVASKSPDEGGGTFGHRPLKSSQSISRRRRQAIRKNSLSSRKGKTTHSEQGTVPLRPADSEHGTAESQQNEQVAIAVGMESTTESYGANAEDLYDEVTTLQRELLQESKKLDKNGTKSNGSEEMFTESRVSEDLPWRRTKASRTRAAKSSTSFEYFQPLFLESKKNRKAEVTEDVAIIERTNQQPDLIQDAISKDVQETTHVDNDVKNNAVKREKRSCNDYMNVDSQTLETEVASSNMKTKPSEDALYDDVTLGDCTIPLVESNTITSLSILPVSEVKQKSRKSLGISDASEGSTASYIDIEEEILSKRSFEHSSTRTPRSNIKEEVVIQPKVEEYNVLSSSAIYSNEDDYDVLASSAVRPKQVEHDLSADEAFNSIVEAFNSIDEANLSEQAVSDNDAILEKSSSSSCKDSGEDSDTIYANITDSTRTSSKEVHSDDDIYLPETELRESRPPSTYTYDSNLHLKFGEDPDAPRIYDRPDSVVSGNSYLSLLEDFQSMDQEHASYYVSDENLGGSLASYGEQDNLCNNTSQQQSPGDSNRPDVLLGTDASVNASAYQDVHLLKSDIPCEPLALPTPDEYRSIPVKLTPTEDRKKDDGSHSNLPVPPRIDIETPAVLLGASHLSEAMHRQKSKFVNKEPLFQIYQATQRSSDPYARPRLVSVGQPPQSPPPRLPRNLPSPSSPPPPPPTSTPPSLRRGLNGAMLPVESVYSQPQVRSSMIEGNVEVRQAKTPEGQQEERERTVSVTSSVLHRSYWCELREVVKSGVLQEMSDEEKKLQEAMFEVITSEASYLRSLNLVISHFMESELLTSQMRMTDHHTLFSNIKSVRDNSEKLLLELEQRQEESILIMNVCDILLEHLESDNFNCYAIYCANNQYQLRTLDKLKKSSSFSNALQILESDPECQHLDIQSFLMLPFQRITRLPLLVQAMLERIQRLRPTSDECYLATSTLAAARMMAKKCDEEATKMERIEEVSLLARQMEYREGVKKMDISQHTTIIKRGHLSMVTMDSGRLGGAKRKIIKKKLVTKSVYILVFKDKVVVAKEKSKGYEKEKEQRSYRETKEIPRRFEVIDWCQRNLVNVQVVDDRSKLPEGMPPSCNYVFVLTFIQNQQKKQMTYILSASSESERQRWVEAISSTSEGKDGERIYESWDCPQVICIASYQAKENDELTLQINDRMDILTKKVDGLVKGIRVSDYATGWFPASCVEEIVNEHVLARNLKQRHQILSKVDERIKLQKIGK